MIKHVLRFMPLAIALGLSTMCANKAETELKESKQKALEMLYEKEISAEDFQRIEDNAKETQNHWSRFKNVSAEREYWDSIYQAYSEQTELAIDSLNNKAAITGYHIY